MQDSCKSSLKKASERQNVDRNLERIPFIQTPAPSGARCGKAIYTLIH